MKQERVKYCLISIGLSMCFTRVKQVCAQIVLLEIESTVLSVR